jgi:aminoglycoside 2'-N-acetyltransferase I
MAAVRLVSTAELSAAERSELRALLDGAYEGAFAEEDWEHALGGVHVLLREADELVGHVSVVRRRLVHGSLSLQTAYLEALAVREDMRRRGHGDTLMSAAEQLIVSEYELGALSDGTGIDGFYERRGWRRWQGPTWTLAPGGQVRTPDEDGGVLVLRTPSSPELDLAGPIACDWRSGDVW